MGIVHPHLSCEHVDGIHIVKKQKGVDIKLSTLQQEKMLTFSHGHSCNISRLLIKVSAYICEVARISNMILNIG
jgi:hypothetical protein